MGAGELRLTIEANRRGRTLVFKNLRSGEIFPLPLTHHVEQAVREWRERFSGLLMPFHETAVKIATARPEERWRMVEQAVRRLREISLGMLDLLTGGSTRKGSLQDFLSGAIPETWDAREHPARIQLLVDEDNLDLLGLPIEYLPLGRTLPPPRIENPTVLQDALSPVAGFAAIIARRLDVGSTMHNYLEPDNNGKLLGKAVSYSNFHTEPQFKRWSEAIWLDSRRSSCTVEPIWPDDSTMADDTADVLARCLFDPRFEFRNPTLRTSGFDQLQHFSCHYERPSETSLGRLKLRDKRLSIAIELLSLRTSLSDLQSTLNQPDDRPPGPFIFVNACHSGAAPTGLFSLVKTLYLETGARALLATETEVEFKLAAAFARPVYTELFRGRTLGTAVHQARWELVLRDNNPFGILYTLYGDPELHCIRSTTGRGFISSMTKRPSRSARA
jgi:hypothetical protein